MVVRVRVRVRVRLVLTQPVAERKTVIELRMHETGRFERLLVLVLRMITTSLTLTLRIIIVVILRSLSL